MDIKRNLKLSIVLVLLVTLLIPGVSSAKGKTVRADISDDIVITVNGEKVPFKAAIIEGRTYLPVRVIGYALNADVDWQEKDRQIHLYFKKERISLQTFADLISPGKIKNASFIDDMYIYLDKVPKNDISKEIAIIDARSYLPLRVISEEMGIRSTWIAETQTIEIVNPRTAIIPQGDEELYIKELPKITTNEDYIVGNWIGNNSSSINDVAYYKDSKLFISEQANGKYRVHRKDVYNDPVNTKYNGFRTETLYTDVFIDGEGIMLLGPHNGEMIFNDTGVNLEPARKPYHLDGERLFGDFTNIGHLKSEYRRF